MSKPPSPLRDAGLQCQRMQLAAHFSLERVIDDLVLLDARFAAEGFGDDGRGIVIAVAGEIADRRLGFRTARPDQAPDIIGRHGHSASPRWTPSRRASSSRSSSWLSRIGRGGKGMEA